MKRILGIVASQRVLGNSELLTKAAMEATGADTQKEMIRLTDLNIKSCKACYRCLPPDVPCHINDDLQFLLDKIRAADAVVIAAPCYFLGPQGSIRVFQDRFLSVGNKAEEFRGKPCICIMTYGATDMKGYAEAALNLIRMHDREYAAFYTAKYNEAHTHKHKRALVLTARKLVRLVYALLRTNQLYIPRKYKYAPLLLARSLAQ
jgi:multimeric flavodoxin WrbA